MSQINKDSAWETFWVDADHNDKLMHLGWWADESPVQFEEAFDEFREQVLSASGTNPINFWTMDDRRQDVFIEWLTESKNLSWEKYLDQAFQDYCEGLECKYDN